MPSAALPPGLLDVNQAAAFLGRNVHYLRRRVQHREIRHYKVGHRLLFHPRDLDTFLAACAVEAQPSERGGR